MHIFFSSREDRPTTFVAAKCARLKFTVIIITSCNFLRFYFNNNLKSITERGHFWPTAMTSSDSGIMLIFSSKILLLKKNSGSFHNTSVCLAIHTHTQRTNKICFTSLLYGHISYPAHFRVSGGCEYINMRLIRAPSLGLAGTTPIEPVSLLTQQFLRDSQHFSVWLRTLPFSCEQVRKNNNQIFSIYGISSSSPKPPQILTSVPVLSYWPLRNLVLRGTGHLPPDMYHEFLSQTVHSSLIHGIIIFIHRYS